MKNIIIFIVTFLLAVSCKAQNIIEADEIFIRDSLHMKSGGTWYSYEANSIGGTVDLSTAPDGAILFEVNDTIGWSPYMVVYNSGEALIYQDLSTSATDYGLYIDMSDANAHGIAINNSNDGNCFSVNNTGDGYNIFSSVDGGGIGYMGYRNVGATGDLLLFIMGSAQDTTFRIDKDGYVYMYDSLYMYMFNSRPYSRYLHLYVDTATMSVKVDSIAFAASKGLTEPLPDLSEVLNDTRDGEIKWGYYDLNGDLYEQYGMDGSPRQMYGMLQRQVEHNMRYIEDLQWKLKSAKWVIFSLLILITVFFSIALFKK